MVKRKRDQIEVTRAATDWLLVTGQPSCGKTTAVKRLVKLLQSKGVRCKGFYTEEVVNGSGARVGFDVVTIPDAKRDVLSRKEGFFKSKYKTGQYYVDRESFEDLALRSLSTEGIIDDDDRENRAALAVIAALLLASLRHGATGSAGNGFQNSRDEIARSACLRSGAQIESSHRDALARPRQRWP